MKLRTILFSALAVVCISAQADAQKPFPIKGENGLYCYFDMDGNQLTEYKYAYAWRFTGNTARVNVGGEIQPNGSIKGGTWGFVDQTGKEVIPAIYDGVAKYSDTVMRLRQGDLYGLVVLDTGEELQPVVYTQIGAPENGYIRVQRDGKWGFLDAATMAIFIECTYDTCYPFDNGYAKVNKGGIVNEYNFIEGGQWGFIQAGSGQIEYYDLLGPSSEGYTAVARGDKWGFILNSGKPVLEPAYDLVDSFKGGYAKVRNNGLWGLVDGQGKVVIECGYGRIEPFEADGTARVELDGAWGCVKLSDDGSAREILTPAFEALGSFSEGLARVRMVGRWGYVDMTGAEMVPMKYADAEDFEGGYAAVKSRNKWGVIDTSGQVVVKASYATAAEARAAIPATSEAQ